MSIERSKRTFVALTLRRLDAELKALQDWHVTGGRLRVKRRQKYDPYRTGLQPWSKKQLLRQFLQVCHGHEAMMT